MKVALIGIGGMGGLHFNIYKALEKAELVAVCDIDAEKINQKTEGMNLNHYTDIDDLLANEKPDLIDICTPTFFHMEHIVKALKSGANVICEKPLALSSKQTQIILDTIEETGKLFMTAHVVRFMSNYKYLKSVIDSKKYGKLVGLSMKRISSFPRWNWENWYADEKLSGLSVLDLMIHDVDFMQYALGTPKDATGVRYKFKDYNDYTAVTYIYDDFTVSIEAGEYNTKIPFRSEFLAMFENGYLELKNNVLTECNEVVDLAKDENLNQDTGINISSVDGYGDEIEYFMDCIEKGIKPSIVTPKDAANSVKLIEMLENKLAYITYK